MERKSVAKAEQRNTEKEIIWPFSANAQKTARQMTTKGSQLHMAAGAQGGGEEGVAGKARGVHMSHVCGRWFWVASSSITSISTLPMQMRTRHLLATTFYQLTIGLRPRHRQSRRCCCRCRCCWPRPAFADGQLRWPSSWPWRDHATPCQAWTGFSSLPLLVADDDHVGDGAGAGAGAVAGDGYDATWLIGQLRQRRRIFLRLLWHTTICGKFSWETFSFPPPLALSRPVQLELACTQHWPVD